MLLAVGISCILVPYLGPLWMNRNRFFCVLRCHLLRREERGSWHILALVFDSWHWFSMVFCCLWLQAIRCNHEMHPNLNATHVLTTFSGFVEVPMWKWNSGAIYMEVLVRSDRDPFERIGDQWGSSLGAIEAGTLLSMEICFTVSHFLAELPLAYCQCGDFEGSRQIYGYLDMPVVELGESSIVWYCLQVCGCVACQHWHQIKAARRFKIFIGKIAKNMYDFFG